MSRCYVIGLFHPISGLSASNSTGWRWVICPMLFFVVAFAQPDENSQDPLNTTESNVSTDQLDIPGISLGEDYSDLNASEDEIREDLNDTMIPLKDQPEAMPLSYGPTPHPIPRPPDEMDEYTPSIRSADELSSANADIKYMGVYPHEGRTISRAFSPTGKFEHIPTKDLTSNRIQFFPADGSPSPSSKHSPSLGNPEECDTDDFHRRAIKDENFWHHSGAFKDYLIRVGDGKKAEALNAYIPNTAMLRMIESEVSGLNVLTETLSIFEEDNTLKERVEDAFKHHVFDY